MSIPVITLSKGRSVGAIGAVLIAALILSLPQAAGATALWPKHKIASVLRPAITQFAATTVTTLADVDAVEKALKEVTPHTTGSLHRDVVRSERLMVNIGENIMEPGMFPVNFHGQNGQAFISLTETLGLP